MELKNGHFPAERQQLILAEIAASGAVRVEDLGRRFDVSEMTIRRDLDALEAQGVIERTHGGAVAPRELTQERRYREKDLENRDAKEHIGRLAAEMTADGETVLINSGSTTRQVIRHLAGRKFVRIVTNNVAAVSDLPENPQAEILLLGGRFRDASGCAVGEWALKLLERISPSRVILGADGISRKDGLSSPIPEEAELTRQMIKRSRGPVVVVADAGKMGRVCGFHIAPLSAIDTLVCDADAAAPWRRDFSAAGVNIVGPEAQAADGSLTPDNGGSA